MRQHYSEEEAYEILRRAAERQALGGEMSRDQLVKLASDVGIAPEALDRAEQEWETERHARGLRATFEAEQRAEFRSHLVSYIGVIGFLFLLNRVVSPGAWWAIFPMLGWGLGLFFHAMHAYGILGIEKEEEFRKWLGKRQARAIEAGDIGPNPYALP